MKRDEGRMSHEKTEPDGRLLARERQLQQVQEVRHRLLDLHKAIVDAERVAYERLHGRVTASEFLRVLINEDEFAWLRPLTALIVQLDELVEARGSARERDVEEARGSAHERDVEEARGSARERRIGERDRAPAQDASAWRGELTNLLRPDPKGGDFQRRYAELLQSSPDVTLAHAAVTRAGRGWSPST
jgi:hypothetical protein